MTGPEHYFAAEQLIRRAEAWENADTGWKAHMSAEERVARRTADLAEAQVHATLALAAATALSAGKDGMPHSDFSAWDEVAGEA